MRYSVISDISRLSWTICHTIRPTPSYVISWESICFFHRVPLSTSDTSFPLSRLLRVLSRRASSTEPRAMHTVPSRYRSLFSYRSPLETRGKANEIFRHSGFSNNETLPLTSEQKFCLLSQETSFVTYTCDFAAVCPRLFYQTE